MNRESFLKLSCTGCMLGAAGLISVTELLSCAAPESLKTSKAVLNQHMLHVPLSNLNAQGLTIVRASGMDYDIAVRKEEGNTFLAMELRCTHFNNPLQAAGSHFHCDLHGSEFDAQGAVIKGPASLALQHLPWSISGEQLIIQLQ